MQFHSIIKSKYNNQIVINELYDLIRDKLYLLDSELKIFMFKPIGFNLFRRSDGNIEYNINYTSVIKFQPNELKEVLDIEINLYIERLKIKEKEEREKSQKTFFEKIDKHLEEENEVIVETNRLKNIL